MFYFPYKRCCFYRPRCRPVYNPCRNGYGNRFNGCAFVSGITLGILLGLF